MHNCTHTHVFQTTKENNYFALKKVLRNKKPPRRLHQIYRSETTGKAKQVSRARNPSIRKSEKLFILVFCWYVVQVSYLWLKMFKIVCF